MITVNKHLTAPVSAVALGLVLAALASPSFAQRSETHMSAARAAAIHECNLRAARYRQYTWAIPRSTRTGPACQNTASRNNACCSALVRSTSKRGRPTVRAGASGSRRGKRGGNGQFRAPKAGLRMISRSESPEFDVIDRGMAAPLD
jgi:Tfp pilus assembly protein PilE